MVAVEVTEDTPTITFEYRVQGVYVANSNLDCRSAFYMFTIVYVSLDPEVQKVGLPCRPGTPKSPHPRGSSESHLRAEAGIQT